MNRFCDVCDIYVDGKHYPWSNHNTYHIIALTSSSSSSLSSSFLLLVSNPYVHPNHSNLHSPSKFRPNPSSVNLTRILIINIISSHSHLVSSCLVLPRFISCCLILSRFVSFHFVLSASTGDLVRRWLHRPYEPRYVLDYNGHLL